MRSATIPKVPANSLLRMPFRQSEVSAALASLKLPGPLQQDAIVIHHHVAQLLVLRARPAFCLSRYPSVRARVVPVRTRIAPACARRPLFWIQCHYSFEGQGRLGIPVGVVVERSQRPPTFHPFRIERQRPAVCLNRLIKPSRISRFIGALGQGLKCLRSCRGISRRGTLGLRGCRTAFDCETRSNQHCCHRNYRPC